MATLEERATAAATVGQAAQGLDAQAQRELVERAIPNPDQRTTNVLWVIFVAGVLLLIGLFGTYVYDLIRDNKVGTDPALVGQFVTFLAGSLVGLFIKSPVQA
jgi:hypothetical protein